MPSGARGGVFHLGYKLAITAHEVGGERTRSGISTRRGPGAGQLGGPSRIGENSCSVSIASLGLISSTRHHAVSSPEQALSVALSQNVSIEGKIF